MNPYDSGKVDNLIELVIELISHVELVIELISHVGDAWQEGASDCHTTGEQEHYYESDAFKAVKTSEIELQRLRRGLGL